MTEPKGSQTRSILLLGTGASYLVSLFLILVSLFQRTFTILNLAVPAAVNVGALIGFIFTYRMTASEKQPEQFIENPWLGTRERVNPETPQLVKREEMGFKVFLAKTLASATHSVHDVKPSNPFQPRLFKKTMRFLAGALIFIYTIVLFFSFSSIISLLFITTDIVLGYMIYLSRK